MKTQAVAHIEREITTTTELITRYVRAMNECLTAFKTTEARQIALYSIQMQINKLQVTLQKAQHRALYEGLLSANAIAELSRFSETHSPPEG